MINTVYNENCLETMSRMADGLVQLVITSPPYNMRLRIRNGQYTEREKGESFSRKYQYFDDALPIEEFYSFHKKVLTELLRVSKVICYNFQIVTGSKEAFFKLIGEFSGSIKDIIIWDKGHGQPSMHESALNSCYEIILVLESDNKKGRTISNAKFERGKMNNILRINRDKSITDSHSAVFPEKLVSTLINAFSEEGDIVYDPFGGTGTVAKVAHSMKREWVLSEIVPNYAKLAKRVMDAVSSQIKAEL